MKQSFKTVSQEFQMVSMDISIVWNNMKQYGTIWNNMEQFGTI